MQFDAFSSAPTPVTAAQPSSQFNAFSNPGNNIMGGSGSMMMQQQQQHQQPIPVMGNNNMMGFNSMNGGSMAGTIQPPKQQQFQSAPDDDFGDFAAASATPAPKHVGLTPNVSKPLDKLISLDGLSKNKADSLEDKLNQPIIANAAAATFVQEKEHIQAAVQQSAKGSTMSFAGIDGLHKSSMAMSSGMTPGMMMSPPMSSMGMMNPAVMGGSGNASSSMIGMLDPNEMMAKKPAMTAVPQQPGGMMMNSSGMGMMPGMAAGSVSNNMTMNPMAQQPMGMNNMSMMNAMPMQSQQFGGNMMMNQGFGGMSPGMPQQQQGFGMQQGNMGMAAGQPWNMSGAMGQQQQQQQQQQNGGIGGQPPMGGFR
jgi:hypothetical protein